jgi:hypothetical protein
MAAAPENVELTVLYPLVECQRRLQRNHPIIAAMQQQRVVLDRNRSG